MQKHRLPHIRTVCTLALLLALGAPLAHAGFDEGHAAYQRGDYATALKELNPLAHAGDAAAQTAMGVLYRTGHGVPPGNKQAVP